jgi:hypothetical protein
MRLVTNLVLAGILLLAAGCTDSQRDSALSAVREMQSSGVAMAAETVGQPAQSSLDPGPKPPADGGDAAGDADKQPGADAEAVAPGSEAQQPEAEAEAQPDAIAAFIDSDPRDILVAKSKDLKERQTNPSDETKPETFIPETGRKDPMTIVLNSVPKELLPPRSADDDESDLQTYLFTALATQALQGVSSSLACHNVIQIGIQKYAQLSFGGGPRFTVSEGSGFGENTRVGPIVVAINITVASISTKEVVVDVSVVPQGTAVNVSKQLVFIPRF